MTPQKMLLANKRNYEKIYKDKNFFLQYPADWIIRFWNIYLKSIMPWGVVLDYGCGSGNNSVFFLQKGYAVHGIDIIDTKEAISENLFNYRLPASFIKRFSIIDSSSKLPFKDDTFDFILANQVLYYLPEKHLKETCKELFRVLRNGGIIFITMMGNEADYIANHTIERFGRICHVRINDATNRLNGRNEYILSVKDKEDLKKLFNIFHCVSTGHFDQDIMGYRNYHHIFVGRKLEQGWILEKITKEDDGGYGDEERMYLPNSPFRNATGWVRREDYGHDLEDKKTCG